MFCELSCNYRFWSAFCRRVVLFKKKNDQAKTETPKIFITENIRDVFQDKILPHCVNISSLSALSLVDKRLNENCKKLIYEQKTKLDALVTLIRSCVPCLKSAEMPKPSADDNPITITIPTENNLGKIIIKLENIKTLFKYSPAPYSNESWDKIGYVPWHLKDITSDPMDEQTSSLVNLALDKLNKELNVKAKESINRGWKVFALAGYYDVWGEPRWVDFEKYKPMDYGNIANSINHDSMMEGFNKAMENGGYLGNLI